MSPSKFTLAGFALLIVTALTLPAQTIVYNFGVSSGTPSPTSDTIDHVTGGNLSVTNGATNGTSTAQGSAGAYPGASGDYNYFNNVSVGGPLNITTSTYFSFTLSPETGYGVNLTSLSFGARISNVTATPTTFQIYTSADSYGTSIASGTFTKGAWSLYSPTVTSTTTALNAPLTIRIYFLGGDGVSQTGGVRIDDLTITAQAVPEPQTFALIGLGLTGLLLFRKRRAA